VGLKTIYGKQILKIKDDIPSQSTYAQTAVAPIQETVTASPDGGPMDLDKILTNLKRKRDILIHAIALLSGDSAAPGKTRKASNEGREARTPFHRHPDPL
jgi:hypothetical protein